MIEILGTFIIIIVMICFIVAVFGMSAVFTKMVLEYTAVSERTTRWVVMSAVLFGPVSLLVALIIYSLDPDPDF